MATYEMKPPGLSPRICILLLAILCGGIDSLYEDQVGKFDWRHQYVGKVKYFHFDSAGGGQTGKRVIVATEQNVLSALSVKTGQIVWRQVFEQGATGRIDSILHYAENLVSVAGGGKYVRSWSTTGGELEWEVTLPDIDENHIADGLLFGSRNDYVGVLSHNMLRSMDIDNGQVKWTQTLSDSNSPVYRYLMADNNDIMAVGVVAGSHITVSTYTHAGVSKGQSSVPAAWIQADTSCLMVAGGYLVCVDDRTLSLQYLKLNGGTVFNAVTLQELGVKASKSQLCHIYVNAPESYTEFGLRLSSEDMALLQLKEGRIEVVKDLPGVTAMQMSEMDDTPVLLTLGRTSQQLYLTVYDLKTGKERADQSQKISIPAHHGQPDELCALMLRKKDGSTAYRMLVVSEDHSLVLVQQSGKMVWAREEALAAITAVEMVDLPVSENQAKYEDEFGSQKDDVLVMFMKRFKTQFSQLRTYLVQLQHRLQHHKAHHRGNSLDEEEGDNEDDDDDDELTRDEFNLHKMIVVTTAAGKLFGLNSNKGKIVWRHYMKNLAPFERYGKLTLPIYVQRTTAHFPHLPQCMLLGRHKQTGNGLVYYFEPITGRPVDQTPSEGVDLPYKVLQAGQLTVTDEFYLKGLLVLDDKLKFHAEPPTMSGIVRERVGSLYMFTSFPDESLLIGYSAVLDKETQEMVAEERWTVNLQKDVQTITNVVAKRPIEHVHSQGIVLADRSVLYKYLNPNLIVVTAEGQDGTQKAFLNVYLIDAVTGQIVFHCNHKRAKGPVYVVHSENWALYNYWNQKNRRNEMTIVELYEGKKQSNSTAFSSLDPPLPPLVMRQSYIFPGSIQAMAATITEKGITAKEVLVSLSSGGIMELPKPLIDPRRPLIPRQEDREEGIIPYMPELPRSFEAIVNYNQSVFRLQGIHSHPAGLESTSLILAYGLDVFFTRVMPSRMFDVLKEDFDYYFIACVLSGMIVVSIISQKLAARKALNRAWK